MRNWGGGGDDIDQALMVYCRQHAAIAGSTSVSTTSGSSALWLACRRAKGHLCHEIEPRPVVTIPVPCSTTLVPVTITPAIFDTIIMTAWLDRARTLIQAARNEWRDLIAEDIINKKKKKKKKSAHHPEKHYSIIVLPLFYHCFSNNKTCYVCNKICYGDEDAARTTTGEAKATTGGGDEGVPIDRMMDGSGKTYYTTINQKTYYRHHLFLVLNDGDTHKQENDKEEEDAAIYYAQERDDDD